MNYLDVEHHLKPKPHDKIDWITLDVFIRREEDGAVVLFRSNSEVWDNDNVQWVGHGWSEFYWSEGNNSCDCNRHLDFWRALGEEPDDIDCSDGLYKVRIVVPKTGEVLYDEWDEPDIATH